MNNKEDSKSQNDDVDAAIVVEDSLEPSGGGGGESSKNGVGGGGGSSRVKGPWSPEEDAVLSRLVSQFGARNWGMIARGIPGRSGKSCRLRWCNQLDPCLKRKPFTDEEDRIIIQAHAVHGNKWAVIARLLPGRTDNGIKNHWNSTLRRRYAELGRFKPAPGSNVMEDVSIEGTKVSSEETLSVGDVNSLKAPEGRDVTMDHRPNQHEDMAQMNGDQFDAGLKQHSTFPCPVGDLNSFELPDKRDVVMDDRPKQHEDTVHRKESQFAADPRPHPLHPTLQRPVARVSAFSLYYSPSGLAPCSDNPRTVPTQGPLVQAPRPEFGGSKVCSEPIIPWQCGYGCCASPMGYLTHGSLLGPEFVDYEEPPAFSSHELISIATDLNNIAWIKSGLENSSVGVPSNAASQKMAQGTATGSQMEISEQSGRKDMHFEDGRNKFMGMMTDALPSQVPRQPFAVRTEVEGLS